MYLNIRICLPNYLLADGRKLIWKKLLDLICCEFSEALNRLNVFSSVVNCQTLTCNFYYLKKVRDQMAVTGVKPFDEWIPQADLPAESLPCSTGQTKNEQSSPQ